MSEIQQTTAPATTQAVDATPATVVTEAPKAEATTETKTEPPKEAPAAPAKVEPVKFDLKHPEGSLLNPKRIEEIVAEAKASGLTPEQAQANVDREHKAIATFQEAQKQQLTQNVEQWRKDFENDKEIGGNLAKESAEHAKRFVTKFGSPKLKEALDSSGLGNHPELIRMCAAAGKLLANDKFVQASASPKQEKSLSEIFYPKKE